MPRAGVCARECLVWTKDGASAVSTVRGLSRRRCSRARLRPRRRMTRSSPSPSILPSRGSPPSTCSPPRRKTRAGAGPGPEAVAGRASAATRRPPRTPPHPVISVPQGFNPRPPPYIINITVAPRAGTPLRRVPRGTPSPRARTSTNPLPPRASPPTPPRWSRGNPTACCPHPHPGAARAPRLRLHRRQLEDPPAAPVDQPTGPPRRPQAREHPTPGRRYRGPHLGTHDSFRAPQLHNGGELPRGRFAARLPGSPRSEPVSIPPLLPRAAPRDYAALQPPPLPPTRTLPRRRHASSPARRTRFSRRNSCTIRCRRRLDSTSPDWTTPRTRVATKPTTPRARSSG